MRRRPCFFIFAVAIVSCLFSLPAHAWELSLSGTHNWRYEMHSQLGQDGFFGRFGRDYSTLGTGAAAVTNFWNGIRLNFNSDLVSGADAAGQAVYTDIDLKVKLNKAVAVAGRYHIGSWNFSPGAAAGTANLNNSQYLNSRQAGNERSFSPGYWNYLWISARTPLASITMGKRPSKGGCGLIFDGVTNYTVETLLIKVPYGPFTFGMTSYPARFAGGNYWNLVDKSGIRPFAYGLSMSYSCGSLMVGAGNLFANIHDGPESALDPNVRAARSTYDQQNSWGATYLKYNNGRFFFNTELAWYNRVQYRQRSMNGEGPTGGAGSAFKPTYLENTRYMVETGAVAGPAKLSLLYSWLSGPDRRHGVMIDRQPLRGTPPRTLGNTTVFRPYSYILAFNYGGGNDSFNNGNYGYMTDASAYGIRLDYAVASNLNLFGSFFRADRVSHGYGWGFIRPAFAAATGIPSGSVQYSRRLSFTAPAPAIPDPDLGYEVDWGFSWQLLDKYTIDGVFGIWKPGKWFNYACIDRSNPGWKAPAPANFFGISPNREIDPVFCMEIALRAEL